jgi:hypothetical protein
LVISELVSNAELHGRGLLVVETAYTRWGIHESTAHVWFKLDTPAT